MEHVHHCSYCRDDTKNKEDRKCLCGTLRKSSFLAWYTQDVSMHKIYNVPTARLMLRIWGGGKGDNSCLGWGATGCCFLHSSYHTSLRLKSSMCSTWEASRVAHQVYLTTHKLAGVGTIAPLAGTTTQYTRSECNAHAPKVTTRPITASSSRIWTTCQSKEIDETIQLNKKSKVQNIEIIFETTMRINAGIRNIHRSIKK